MSSCRVDKPSEIVDVGDKVWVKLIGREMRDDKVKLSLSMKVVNQGTGKDLDPNNIITDQEERGGRGPSRINTGQKITLEAVLNTTCKKCGCKGHFAKDCFMQPGGTKYSLIPEEEEEEEEEDAAATEREGREKSVHTENTSQKRKKVRPVPAVSLIVFCPSPLTRKRKRKRNTRARSSPHPATPTLTAARGKRPSRSRDVWQRTARGRRKSTRKRARSEGQTPSQAPTRASFTDALALDSGKRALPPSPGPQGLPPPPRLVSVVVLLPPDSASGDFLAQQASLAPEAITFLSIGVSSSSGLASKSEVSCRSLTMDTATGRGVLLNPRQELRWPPSAQASQGASASGPEPEGFFLGTRLGSALISPCSHSSRRTDSNSSARFLEETVCKDSELVVSSP
ncbi:nucleolar protein of 40 kDa isoform X2 [Dromiciops gliroides]|nr:nucleolar protein of 40 kDa isoform X2 [Dromiciops gliroides]